LLNVLLLIDDKSKPVEEAQNETLELLWGRD